MMLSTLFYVIVEEEVVLVEELDELVVGQVGVAAAGSEAERDAHRDLLAVLRVCGNSS